MEANEISPPDLQNITQTCGQLFRSSIEDLNQSRPEYKFRKVLLWQVAHVGFTEISISSYSMAGVCQDLDGSHNR